MVSTGERLREQVFQCRAVVFPEQVDGVVVRNLVGGNDLSGNS